LVIKAHKLTTATPSDSIQRAKLRPAGRFAYRLIIKGQTAGDKFESRDKFPLGEWQKSGDTDSSPAGDRNCRNPPPAQVRARAFGDLKIARSCSRR
jgi:hypothetical protein